MGPSATLPCSHHTPAEWKRTPTKPANCTLQSLPQHNLTTDHMCSTWFWETGQPKENSVLLYPMRDGTLSQSYKCKCANGRLEHFTHWHFIHMTPAAWEVQMHRCVNTFRKKYFFHSGNVKPGCTRNIHVLSLLLHWSSEYFSVHIATHIHSTPFSMQMAHGVPAGSPGGLKPSHACLTAATRQISQLPPRSSLWAFPVWSWKAPASALVSQSYLRTPKAEALPCKTTPVKMSFLLHLDKSSGTQQRWTEWGDGEPWWVRPGPTLLSGATKGTQIS